MNIGSVLTKAAAQWPERTAIIQGDLRRSYRELNARADRLAAALRAAGVTQGDRVAILQRNGAELLETLFAIFKAGAVAVPINARLHPKEFYYILEHSGAKALVFTEEFTSGIAGIKGELPGVAAYLAIGRSPDWARPYEASIAEAAAGHADVEVGAEELGWIFYTSGTTGRPKGAMVTHGNLQFMIDHYGPEVYQLGPDDVVLHAGPLTHGSGLWALPITAGGGTQLLGTATSFDPEHIFQLIERHRATQIAFVAPTMITMLLNSPAIGRYDLSSLRFIGYGGSSMYVEDLKRAITRWGSILCQVYGQGECPMTISLLAPADHRLPHNPTEELRLSSAGKPRRDIEVVVLDDKDEPLPVGQLGEIALRGGVVMKGYWHDDKATAEAFKHDWYHTGDLGRIDEDGFVYLLDRKKEMIISGGANVYPREVEEVLLLHPAILEVAVIGLPDRLWGESVLAVVRPRQGEQVTEAALVELCRSHLAGYKKPRYFRFVDDLPKNAYGKILKRELRQHYAEEFAGAAS